MFPLLRYPFNLVLILLPNFGIGEFPQVELRLYFLLRLEKGNLSVFCKEVLILQHTLGLFRLELYLKKNIKIY